MKSPNNVVIMISFLFSFIFVLAFGGSVYAQEDNATADLQLITTQAGAEFPLDHNAAFECNTNFNATNYTFSFGDGISETRPVFDIYHTYEQNGTFTVTCNASNEEQIATDSISVNIMTGKIDFVQNPFMFAAVDVSQINQDNLTATFLCEDYGFEGESYFWNINDEGFPSRSEYGDMALGGKAINWTFSEPGSYQVTCRSHLTDAEQTPVFYDYATWYHDFDCRGAFYGDCAAWRDTKSFAINLQGTSPDVNNETDDNTTNNITDVNESTNESVNDTTNNQTPVNISDDENEINTTTTTTSSNGTTLDGCYNSVRELPVNCSGTITNDEMIGARAITCSDDNGSVNIHAWEKIDLSGKFFEIWHKNSIGTPPEVCFGDDCIRSGWGYERGSHFPICGDDGNVNETPAPQNYFAQISVASWYPKGSDFVFKCQIEGVTATSYDWDFGDGQKIYDLLVPDVYHTFQTTGQYLVTCSPSDDKSSIQTGIFEVNVTN
jgi:plastocyanin